MINEYLQEINLRVLSNINICPDTARVGWLKMSQNGTQEPVNISQIKGQREQESEKRQKNYSSPQFSEPGGRWGVVTVLNLLVCRPRYTTTQLDLHNKISEALKKIPDTTITSQHYHLCVCVGRTFRIYSLSSFHIYDIVLLFITTTLCLRSPELMHLLIEVCTFCLMSPHYCLPKPLEITAFSDSTYK